jgi:hypothetical protein
VKKKGISLGRGFDVGSDGTIKKRHYYPDASAAIRAKKSKKTRVVSGQRSLALPPGTKKR